jgi:glucose 1-dehydrogenase
MGSVPGRLQGRIALVTGASRGIGRAVAERFAAEGATVVLNHAGDAEAAEQALAAARLASEQAGHPHSHHGVAETDIADAAAGTAMVERCVATYGRIDILVNNAGIVASTPGERFDTAEFDRVLAVNLTGAVHLASAAIRHFLSRQGGGVVINTSSVHEIIPKPGFLAYAISKSGMGALTRTLALEFAGRGIRVNTVAPGATLTDMNRSWANEPEKRADVESHIPMGRAARPEEIAAVFAFLASDDASYITGQTIPVCGGLTLYADFRANWST